MAKRTPATAHADRTGGPQRAGDLIDALLGGPMGTGLSAAQQAARAWYAANGDRERSHTTGVWLRKSGRAGTDPVLVVQLDAAWLAGELACNKDLYLSRLAFSHVHVSDIRFQVGQPSPDARARGRRPQGVPGAAPAHAAREAQLSAEERARVERACAGLPDGLRQSASRAMCASLLRNRSYDT